MSDLKVEMPQPLGMFADDLFSRAKEYLAGFERLAEVEPQRLLHARYFLLAHSLELALKAYLATRNMLKNDIKDLRHKLPKIWRKCKEYGIPETTQLPQLVELINEMNREHDFRYPIGYALTLPPSADCQRIMRSLIQTLEPLVDQARTRAELDFTREMRNLSGKEIRWSD